MVVVWSALLIFLLIPLFIFAYWNDRKPRNLRVFITLVQLRVVWIILDMIYSNPSEQPSYTCASSGHAEAKFGPSYVGMQIAGLFTSFFM